MFVAALSLGAQRRPCSLCAATLISRGCSSFPLVSFSPSADFNYNTDGYEGDGAEDGKSQDGSETLPYIDESPTMSPQLCAPQGPDGGVSPTPPEGMLPGVRMHFYAHTHGGRCKSAVDFYTCMSNFIR